MTHKKLLERNRKITDALQNGAKVTDLAQEHGLSPQTVYHIAQAEMEKRRKVTFTEWKDNRNDEIRNQYQEGISAEELAKAFNLNRATIFRILKEGGDSYHRHLDTKIETSTLRRIKDFKQGFVDYAKKNPNTPVENLAREYGISPSSGFKYLHEAGIYRGKGRKKKAAKPNLAHYRHQLLHRHQQETLFGGP